MFLSNYLFLEADDEKNEQPPTNVNNDKSLDNGGFEDEENMDGGDGIEETESDIGDETLDDNSTDSMSSNNVDNHKKYVLIQEYKELLFNINYLKESLQQLKKQNSIKYELIIFFDQKISCLENLKNKINFHVKNNFINKSYEELLTSFLYLKKEFQLLVNIIEKTLKEIDN